MRDSREGFGRFSRAKIVAATTDRLAVVTGDV
jgi:hypothetical protein